MRDRALARHFLQRFLDNDLISPHADRRDTFTLIAAVVISTGVFLSMFASLKYAFMPFQSPGRTSILLLDDVFFFSACSMIGMALVAVAVWDGLALDARDAAILGPLPVSRARIVRAKAAAVSTFAASFAIALNGGPGLLYPITMLAKLPIGFLSFFVLVAAHVGTTMAAGAFGFLSVVGIREALRAIVGDAVFRRVSLPLEGLLVVGLVTWLLLVPGLSVDVIGRRLLPNAPRPHTAPFLWFVGLHETLANGALDLMPTPPLPARVLRLEMEAAGIYRSHYAEYSQLSRQALQAIAIVFAVAAVAYAWNSRRLPEPRAVTMRRPGTVSAILGAAALLMVRQPASRAGFFFTLQTLSRSAPHRLALAASLAIGIAASIVSVRSVDLGAGAEIAMTPVSVLMVQTILVVSLLVGFRHAIRVPAELKANWTFALSFGGQNRGYMSGVKRAGLFALAIPMVAALVPLHAIVLGTPAALAHGVMGLVVAMFLLEALTLGVRTLPFASPYVPSENLKIVGPIAVPLILLAAYALAWLERFALATDRILLMFTIGFVLTGCLRMLGAWKGRRAVDVDLNEAPAPFTQRLRLSE